MERGRSPDELHTITLLMQCNAEIVILESQLEHQRRLRANLKKKLLLIRRKRQNPVIDRVPTEIFSEIFKILTNQDPLAIGAILMVCRHWNRIAYSSPWLWSSISINFVPDPDLIERNTNYLTAAIRNSSSIPLQVDLSFPGLKELCNVISSKLLWTQGQTPNLDQHRLQAEWLYETLGQDFFKDDNPLVPYTDAVQAIEEFMTTLCRTAEIIGRIRSLSMSCREDYFDMALQTEFFRYPMPMLEELSIQGESWLREDPWNFFAYPAPNLTRLSSNLELDYDAIIPQANQLTELDFWVYSQEDFSLLLQHAKSLKYLCLGFDASQYAWYQDRAILPQLEELALRTPFTVNSKPHLIQAPKLKILRILHCSSLNPVLDTISCFLTLKILELWTPTPITDHYKQTLDVCIARLKFLEEISFIHDSDVSCIKECMKHFKKEAISIKGYMTQKRGELERSRWSYEEKGGIEIYLDC